MDFKIYLPREIKKPLIWFLIASVIGIIIQSSKAGHFVFIDFFGKNYIYIMKLLFDSFGGIAFVGFGFFILSLLEIFYYIIMTISLIIIIYHLIATFNKKNTRNKWIFYWKIHFSSRTRKDTRNTWASKNSNWFIFTIKSTSKWSIVNTD